MIPQTSTPTQTIQAPQSRKKKMLAIVFIVLGIVAGNLVNWYLRQPRWETLRSTEYQFSMEFPGTPTHETKKIPIPNTDITLSSDLFSSQHGGRTYIVSVAMYPPAIDVSTPDNNLEGAVQGILNTSPGAELVSNTSLAVQQFPAHDIRIHIKDGDLRARLILANHTLYQLMVTNRTGNWNKPHYDRFINSFAISQETNTR